MIIYTKNVMKYITVLLLAVFLIPFVPNVNAQNIMDQLTGGIQELTGGAGQSANNTSEQAGQAGQNMSGEAGQAGQSMNNTAQQAGQTTQQAGQNMSSEAGQAGQSMNNTAQQAGQNATGATGGGNTTGGGGIGDMLGNLIPGQ